MPGEREVLSSILHRQGVDAMNREDRSKVLRIKRGGLAGRYAKSATITSSSHRQTSSHSRLFQPFETCVK